jgi:hypothetical protein
LTSAEYQPADRAAILKMVEESYSKGFPTFANEIKAGCQHPIEPTDDKGKYRLHPLIWTAILGVVGIVGVILYFHFQS